MGSRYDRGRRGSSPSYLSQRHRNRSRSRTRSRSNSPPSSTSSSASPERDSYSSKSQYYSHHSNSNSRGRDNRSERLDDVGGSNRFAGNNSNGTNDNKQRYTGDSSDDDVKLPPPPPPRISKVTLSIGKPGASAKPVQLKLATPKQPEAPKKLTVASAFSNNDSDDEVEEMPAECRMRMRNIGRDTPTSSGPNSYGKTKQGFCDAKKIFEKQLRDFHDE